jgi:hypothetical protein
MVLFSHSGRLLKSLGQPLDTSGAESAAGVPSPAALDEQGCDELLGFASRLCNEVSHNLGL